MLNSIKQNIKNVVGWKTKRKIVVFLVDDYGNVRLASQQARENLNKAGYPARGHFDEYDTLETRRDLEMLYDVLSSVKGGDGKHACFTPFALPCNIDFERMKEEGYEKYQYELLPITYEKLSAIDSDAYKGTWELWQEGLSRGLMRPQFHGREHLSVRFIEDLLKEKNEELLTQLHNKSFVSLTTKKNKTLNQMAAFGFWDFAENKELEPIIQDGLDAFEKVYGYRSVYCTPPAGSENEVIYEYLHKYGIKYIDTALVKKEHQGHGKYKTKFNYIGKRGKGNLLYMVRNVVFEPMESKETDWVNFTFNQIDRAFRWNRPAMVSSHRVNFCGHIDPKNRKFGLDILSQLLKKIVEKWPDVEFMSADALGDLIAKER